jgi:transposase-like protein
MKGHGAKLPRKRQAALAALLSQETVKQAAAKVGVDESTLRRWMKVPAFRAEYLAARRALLDEAHAELQKAALGGVTTLVRLLNCGHAPTEARAALGVLDQANRALELGELAERLARLEARYEQRRGERRWA